MITKDNLTEVLDLLTKKQINEAMNSEGDMLAFWVGSYGGVHLEPFEGETEDELEAFLTTGGVILDKDDFLRLFEESDSTNPFLKHLI